MLLQDRLRALGELFAKRPPERSLLRLHGLECKAEVTYNAVRTERVCP